ncbi:MAG TPA: GDSL-type esterase/lipase family protein [Tepidisphaeraceae bacterium]|jgi:lysophospholipase L1-like esterase|nr:GDSL-type esterase/lipase family protein [Tepidisphaeraceae bacterium]
MSLKARLIVSSCAFALSLATASAAEAEVLARYRGDFEPKQPAAGWAYLWNAKGEIGSAKSYEPLKWTEDQKTYAPTDEKLPAPAPAAYLAMRQWGGHPGRGATQTPNKVDRYAIAAYTIPAGKTGVAWVTDGQLLRDARKTSETSTTAETVQLRIYLNDQLKQQDTFKSTEQPSTFSVNLGNVTGGETIYVAVGPDGHDLTDGYSYDFRIAVLPVGEQPGETPSALSIVPEDPGVASPRTDKRGEVDPKWMKSHQDLLDRAKNTADAQVVFLGDSITAAWGSAGKTVWENTLKPLRPLNLGIGGDQTQHVLWRIDNGALDGLNPKAVVLLIGTNNTGRYAALEVAHGVEAVVKRLREKLPDAQIILTGIFPRSAKPTDAVRGKVTLANEWIAKLADGKAIHYVDITQQLLEPDGTISKETMPDYLHLATPAYQKWADAVVPLIKSAIE